MWVLTFKLQCESWRWPIILNFNQQLRKGRISNPSTFLVNILKSMSTIVYQIWPTVLWRRLLHFVHTHIHVNSLPLHWPSDHNQNSAYINISGTQPRRTTFMNSVGIHICFCFFNSVWYVKLWGLLAIHTILSIGIGQRE